jgi:signal transduction histidine kinase
MTLPATAAATCRVGTVPGQSVTIRPVEPSVVDLRDPELRERLVEAARLATVGRLVAAFAHQMSTPLAAIALRAESLEQSAVDPERPASPEKTARYLHAITEETSRCQQLLSALRGFGGPLDTRVGPVDVGALCASALLLVRDEAVRRQVELRIETDPRLAPVRGIRARLGQAVLTLLLNAVDASPAGAQVLVAARADGAGGATVSVQDEGEGLPAGGQERMFEPFWSSRSPTHGLGLGLMACRAVIEAHGGTLETQAAGRGCRFVLHLPPAGAPEEVALAHVGA